MLAGILIIPGLATLWTAWDKFLLPAPPAPLPLIWSAKTRGRKLTGSIFGYASGTTQNIGPAYIRRWQKENAGQRVSR